MSKATEAATAWLAGLKQTGAISDEQAATLEAAISDPKGAEYVGSTTLMRSDYSRAQNDLKADYDAKTKELADYQRELANWRGGTEKEVSQVKAELNQLRAERLRLVAVAQSYGLSEDDLGTPVAPFTAHPGTTSPNPKDSDPPAFDASKYITRDEVQKLDQMYTLLPAEIADISAEYSELFGKPIKGVRQLVERAIKEQRSLRDIYEDEFSVSDKRKSIDEAQREAEIKRRVEEQLTAYRTEHPELPYTPSGRAGSPILASRDSLIPEGSTAKASSAYLGNDSVKAAIAHWNSIEHKDI